MGNGKTLAPPKRKISSIPSNEAVSFDTETTSVDLRHGGLPYSVQICFESGRVHYFHWRVDPFTREVAIEKADLEKVLNILTNARIIIGHNIKFDMRAIDAACKKLGITWEWDFAKLRCTLIKSHVLRNLWSHSLKALRDIFFGVDRTNQDQLKLLTHKARRIADSKAFIAEHGNWRIARESDPHWPAVKRAPSESSDDIEGWWLYDTWLPRELTLRTKFGSPEMLDVSKIYGIEDAQSTLILNEALDDAIAEEGLTRISDFRHQLIEETYLMEETGVALIPKKCREEIMRYRQAAYEQQQFMLEVAKYHGMEDYNPDSDQQLRELLFVRNKIPILGMTDPSNKFPEGQPKVDAATLTTILNNFPEDVGPEIKEYIECHLFKSRSEKAADSIDSWLAWSVRKSPVDLRIHSSINITGTKFTRQSSNDPNLQNCSTGKLVLDIDGNEVIDYVTREGLGPSKGTEWLSIDLQSVEYLIWGYSSGNKAVKECYESGEPLFKPIMESIWGFFNKEDKKYKKSKNGIYSRIYGASERHADKTFGKEGAVRLIDERMPEIRAFTKKLHDFAKKYGYITTLGGYRLYIPISEPHKAVSAFVQGHAGWLIGLAMRRCGQWLRQHDPRINIILQIHDELIFEGPIGFAKAYADELASIIRNAGEEFGIPTPVNKSLISNNWGESIPL